MTTLKKERISQETLERHAVLVPRGHRDSILRILGVIGVIAAALAMGFLVVQSDDTATTSEFAIPVEDWVLPETRIPVQAEAAQAVSASEAARAQYGLAPFDTYVLPEMFPVYDPYRIAADVWALPEASIAAAEQATERELVMARYDIEAFEAIQPETTPAATTSQAELARLIYGLEAVRGALPEMSPAQADQATAAELVRARYGLEPFDATLPEMAPVSTLSESELFRMVYGLEAFGTYRLPEAFVPEQIVVGDPATVWDPIPAADWVLPEMFPQRNWELPEMFLPEQTTPTYATPAYGPR